MLKKTITYTDFNGNDVTDDFYFNLTQAEILKIEMGTQKAVGLEATVLALQEEKDGGKLMELFERIIRMSIGKKSPDGKRFIKTPEIADEFMETQAYSDLVMSFIEDSSKGAEFFNSIIPQQEKPAIPAPPVK